MSQRTIADCPVVAVSIVVGLCRTRAWFGQAACGPRGSLDESAQGAGSTLRETANLAHDLVRKARSADPACFTVGTA